MKEAKSVDWYCSHVMSHSPTSIVTTEAPAGAHRLYKDFKMCVSLLLNLTN